jgi:hypothetical protein
MVLSALKRTEYLVFAIPSQGVLHRNGVDYPSIVGPPNSNGTENALFVSGVEDVCIAVRLQKARPTVSLSLKKGEGRGNGAFDFGFAAEFRNDGAIWRDAQKLVFAVRHCGNRVFGFVEESGFELAPNCREFHPGILIEKIPDYDRCRCGRNDGGFKRLEKGRLGIVLVRHKFSVLLRRRRVGGVRRCDCDTAILLEIPFQRGLFRLWLFQVIHQEFVVSALYAKLRQNQRCSLRSPLPIAKVGIGDGTPYWSNNATR